MRLFSGLLLGTSLLVAQAPTLEQSISLRRASEVALSPDGGHVAYTVSRTNWDDNAFESEIWLADTAGSRRFRLTGGAKSSSAPAWSPDGQRIAFLSDRSGKMQLYLIAAGGGESVQLTAHEQGVGGYRWMPDGTAILFSASDPEPQAMKDRKKKFGEFSVVNGDYTRTHLWRIAVPAAGDLAPPKAQPERLTEGEAFSVQSFRISPDGRRVAFAAVKDPNLSAEPADIWVLTLADKLTRRVVDWKGPDTSPVWSPDSTRIAFTTAHQQTDYYYRNNKLAIVPADGGAPRLVPLAFDERISLEEWAPSGIYYTGLRKTSAHLFRADPESGKYERISTPDAAILTDLHFSKDFARLAFSGSLTGGYSEVFVTPVAPFEPKPLSNLGEQLKDYRLAAREVVSWKSADGTLIEGVLLKPADFDPSRKYPLLVVIHGGPTGIDMPWISADRYYPLERFVAKGALVLRPNYRGSAGYGEKFRMLNVRNLGAGDAWDVLSGVDSLIAKGWVDPGRTGAMGWSQGGYISAYLTTTSDRFKAISVGAGISNWMTYYVNTDIHPFTRQYLKATPWDDPQIYAKTSPMTYIKKAKTPTLIQHGEFDRRVPIPNAYELLQGLEDQGVPVKMYVYKGFGHGITKPKEMLAVMQHNYEFFAEYIWGEKPAAAQ